MRHLAGKWIAVDGVDAVGKSTQTEILRKQLADCGIPTLILTEWSDSGLGLMIRQIIDTQRFYALHPSRKTPYADTYSLIADLAYKLEDLGIDAMRSGGVVLSDRGLLSLIAYQAKRVEKHGEISLSSAVDRVESIVMECVKHLRIPDHHILLRIDPDEMQRRVIKRGEAPLDSLDVQFMLQVNDIMLELTNRFTASTLDVTNLSVSEVTEHILSLLNTRPRCDMGNS